jgi:23S rRNA (uracil1939-C5)-methyltransferase
MVILSCATPSLPHLQELLQELQQKIPSLKSVIINYNPTDTNVILGKTNEVIWGEPFIEERLKESRFKIFPGTFFQINSIQMMHIIDKIRNDAGLQSHQQVLELYCGTGTIGLLIADLVKYVIGMDNSVSSIEAAQENMKLNKIRNAYFQLLDAESESLKKLPPRFSPDVIIVDPPRKGLSNVLINDIVGIKPEVIIYLSCNPVTFLPNISELMKSGYQCEEIFLYDMFPHTSQIESLVFLYKNG